MKKNKNLDEEKSVNIGSESTRRSGSEGFGSSSGRSGSVGSSGDRSSEISRGQGSPSGRRGNSGDLGDMNDSSQGRH